MGADHRLYSWLGRWNANAGSRFRAVRPGCHHVGAVVAFGSTRDGFESMVIFTTPAFWFFLMLVGISLFVLRAARPPNRPPIPAGWVIPSRPFSFGASCALMVYASVDYAVHHRSWEAMWSIAILLIGTGLSFCSSRSFPSTIGNWRGPENPIDTRMVAGSSPARWAGRSEIRPAYFLET